MFPYSDAALSDGLTGCQLQEEQGDAHNQHQQDVQQEKGSWEENDSQLAKEQHHVCKEEADVYTSTTALSASSTNTSLIYLAYTD